MIGLSVTAIAPALPAGPHRVGHETAHPRPGTPAPEARGHDGAPIVFGQARGQLIDGASAVAAQESATEKDHQDPSTLTEEERQTVTQMRARDTEVRAHERAHQAAGGAYAGAVSLTYENGPDGKRYAVAGEVPIDASSVDGDPRATIAKLSQVKRAALAPADPSGPDRAIAAAATAAILKAQSALAAERTKPAETDEMAFEIIPPGHDHGEQGGVIGQAGAQFSFTV
jgi:hypothetical protein